jgi:hypothetical protein
MRTIFMPMLPIYERALLYLRAPLLRSPVLLFRASMKINELRTEGRENGDLGAVAP